MVDKIKFTGTLFRLRSGFSILRDILFVIFLLSLLGGVIFVVLNPPSMDGINPLALLTGDLEELGEFDPEGLVEDMKTHFYSGDYDKAEGDLEKIKTLAKVTGADEKTLKEIAQVEEAIKNKDVIAFDMLMEEISGGEVIGNGR